MSVVPCRFFGTPNGCRYGDNCKFYHARGGSNVQGAFGGRSQLFNSGYSQAQQDVLNLTAKSQQNIETMIEMVKRDMVEWDQGKIFPFSTYGPSGGKPCLPGFEEISPDELRYRFYVLNNKTPFDLSREISSIQQTRLQYQQISPAIRNILERVIVKGERIESIASAQNNNPFGGGISQQNSSVFGGSGGLIQQPSSSNIFGQTPSVFGAGNTGQTLGGGVFGGTASGQNLFGGIQQNSSPSNVFGSPPISNQTSNIFGNSATSPTSLFGGPVQQQQPASVFGSGQQQQQGIFGSVSNPTANTTGTGGLFGTPAASTSIFGSAPTFTNNNLFSQQPTQPATGGGLFSTPPTVNTNVFGNNSNIITPASQTFGQQPQQLPSQNQFIQSPTLHGLLTQPQQPLFGAPISNNQQQQQFLQPQQTGLPASGSFFSSPPTASMGIQNSPLQMSQPQTSLFGTPPTQQSAFPTSLFGGNSGGTSVGVSSGQKFVYTEESELTKEELNAFLAPAFTLENIPIRPPPKSLCGI